MAERCQEEVLNRAKKYRHGWMVLADIADFLLSATAVVLADDNSAPSSGNIKLRLVNASRSLGPADVYVNTPGTDINSVGPTISNLAFEAASSYQSLTAANYEVIFTNMGTKFIAIDSGSLSFSTGQIRTFVGLNSRPAGLPMQCFRT